MLKSKAVLVRVVAWGLTTQLIGITAALAEQSDRQPFNIQSQPLAGALSEFARQSKQALLFSPEVVAEKTSETVRGELPPLDALATLLKDTGVDYSVTPNGAILLRSKNTAVKNVNNHINLSESGSSEKSKDSTIAENATPKESEDSFEDKISEIIVTAQKRGDERLLDVPVPITVINAGALASTGQVLLRDYATKVPGLSVQPDIEGSQMISLRGVTTGSFAIPTVGVLIDDVPYNSSSQNIVPDLDPGDLARIEVLRGPQGTLYGANSMGGLLRYVTTDPSRDAWSGRVEGGMSGTQNSSDAGYNLRGSVNAPLGETFAMRVSAFVRDEPGYIDNPIAGLKDVNEQMSYGTRVSVLWAPSEALSIKLAALYQHNKADGSSEVQVRPGLGDLEQDMIPGVGGSTRKVQAYSAVVKVKLGMAELTSVSGFSENGYSDLWDFTNYLGSVAQSLFGVSGSAFHDEFNIKKWSQEVRLSAPLGARVDLLVGGFYTHESFEGYQRIEANNYDTGAVAGLFSDSWFPNKSEEFAAFASLTYRFTDRFDLQIGGRESKTKAENLQAKTISYDPVNPPATSFTDPLHASGSSFTYLLTPRLRLSPDLMIYGRFASGYRPGGINNAGAIVRGAVPTYDPDRTLTYEIGVKGSALEDVFSFDLGVYYIDWSDLQIKLTTDTDHFSYQSNGGKAKSQGAEASIGWRLAKGLNVNAWAAYTDAKLTQNFAVSSPVVGSRGDQLPFSGKLSGSLSIDQEIPLGNRISANVGGVLSYTDKRLSIFQGDGVRQRFPAFTKVDLHASVALNEWKLSLYMNNVMDKRGVVNGGIGFFPPYDFVYITPRNFGISAAKSF